LPWGTPLVSILTVRWVAWKDNDTGLARAAAAV